MRQSIREVLIITVLVMSLTVGAGVVPILFAELSDRMLAGSIAGILFERLAYLNLFLMVLFVGFLDTEARFARLRQILAVLMIITILLGQFVITPKIVSLRSEIYRLGGFDSAGESLRHSFGLYHGVSGTLFLALVLLGIVLTALEFRTQHARPRGPQ